MRSGFVSCKIKNILVFIENQKYLFFGRLGLDFISTDLYPLRSYFKQHYKVM